MTQPRTNRSRTWNTIWILPACALALGVAVIAKTVHGQHVPASRNETTPVTHATQSIDYRPGHIDAPAGWKIIDQRGNVTTWSEPTHDDAVTVASIDSSSAPLAAVVAEVARSSRQLPATTNVAPPHELDVAHGARGDSALMLAMTLRDPQGRTLHVRQIWRRDTRASQDVVATWTSRDDQWPTTPEQGIPGVMVR